MRWPLPSPPGGSAAHSHLGTTAIAACSQTQLPAGTTCAAQENLA